jgi:hypothetical protein
VRDAAQAGLDAADHQRHVGEGFAAALRVDQHRAIGAQPGGGVGRVGIIAADPAIAGVAIDHRVHVAGRDAPEQIGPAERLERGGAAPVRLIEDADAKAVRLEQPADQRHAEARVVDVRVAGHHHDVAAIPAQLVHLGARGWQERRDAEPFRPVRPMRKQTSCRGHCGNG